MIYLNLSSVTQRDTYMQKDTDGNRHHIQYIYSKCAEDLGPRQKYETLQVCGRGLDHSVRDVILQALSK